jgi:hypothetical protein
VTAEVLDLDQFKGKPRSSKLHEQVRKLGAVIYLQVTLLHAFDIRLDPETAASDRTSSKGLVIARRIEESCGLDDRSSCPRLTPTQLTAEEISTMREMVESDEYRYVPTGRLVILAQRLGKVYASATTWWRMVRKRGGCRPRRRVYPAKPKLGVRASHPTSCGMWI